MAKAEALISEVPRLKGLDHIDGDSIRSISDQLRQQIVNYEATLAARRKALEEAIRIHSLTEKVYLLATIIYFYFSFFIRQSLGV